MNHNDLLKRYIKEVLTESHSVNEIGLSSFFKNSGKSKISSWFSSFLSKKLDKISDTASDYISSKLSGVLPDKQAREFGITSTDNTADVLTVIVEEWMKEMKERGMNFSRSERKEMLDVASDEFAKSIRKNKDQNAAILQVYRTLNTKYGSKKTK